MDAQLGGDAWDLPESIRMAVYGRPGTGKTSLWSTFPGPILALICTGAVRSGELKSINTPEMRKKITARIVTSTEQIRANIVEASDGRYGAVVLDHATGLEDLVLKEIKKWEDIPVQKGYGTATRDDYRDRSSICKEILRSILNLSCNVVIVAQEKVFGDEGAAAMSDDIKPAVGPGVGASLAIWINQHCDYIVQTYHRKQVGFREVKVGAQTKRQEYKTGKVDFCLKTLPSEVHVVKFRDVTRGASNPGFLINPTYDSLMEIIRGEAAAD